MHSNIYLIARDANEVEDFGYVDEEVFQLFSGHMDGLQQIDINEIEEPVSWAFKDISSKIESTAYGTIPYVAVHLDRDKLRDLLERRIKKFKKLARDFTLDKYVADRLLLFSLKTAISDNYGFKVIDSDLGAIDYDEWLMAIYASGADTIYVTQVFDYHF